jgi:hypothetical protein
MDTRNFPGQVGPALRRASTDLVQLEQYMDFVRNRTFRQSLLCHARQAPRYELQPEVVTPLWVGSPLQPASARPDLSPSVREDFRGPGGSFAFSGRPIDKAALWVLAEAWPVLLPFPELYARARARLDSRGLTGAALAGEDERQLAQDLLRFCTIASNLVELRVRPLRVTAQPGPQPQARPLARWQARSQWQVTNLRHEAVTLDEFGRQTLLRLDGQHTRAAVVQELAELVQGGQLTIHQAGGEKVTDPWLATQVVQQALEEQIKQLARAALLLA